MVSSVHEETVHAGRVVAQLGPNLDTQGDTWGKVAGSASGHGRPVGMVGHTCAILVFFF